jgi:hypothetical protein
MILAGADVTEPFSPSMTVFDKDKTFLPSMTTVDVEKNFVASALANFIVTLSDFCFVVIKNVF